MSAMCIVWELRGTLLFVFREIITESKCCMSTDTSNTNTTGPDSNIISLRYKFIEKLVN